MTGMQIGEIPIATVQHISSEKSNTEDEIDLIGYDDNILFIREEELTEVEIEFTLLKQVDPLRRDVDVQKDDVKELTSQDAHENIIRYNNLSGFISVNEVEFEAETSKPLRKGVIQGKFLPWPTYYPNENLKRNILLGPDLTLNFAINGNMIKYVPYEADVNLTLGMEDGEALLIDNFLGTDITYEQDLSADIQLLSTMRGTSSLSFIFGGEQSFGEVFGRRFGGSIGSSLIRERSYSVEQEYGLSMEASMWKGDRGSFGREFGGSFGGN